MKNSVTVDFVLWEDLGEIGAIKIAEVMDIHQITEENGHIRGVHLQADALVEDPHVPLIPLLVHILAPLNGKFIST